MKKTTMQDIADALDISRVSVWKVFNNHKGVSSSLREQVMNKANELGYKKTASLSPLPSQMPIYTVSVIISRPESSIFWTNILHRMAQNLLKYNINLLYTYVPSVYTEGFSLPPVLNSQTVQGIVVLNIYDAKMIRLINQLSLPKVFLDIVTEIPFQSLTGDLFLLEGKETCKQLTDYLISKGLTRLGFIGDIAYAKTNADRYEGFLASMSSHELPIRKQTCFTGPICIDTHYENICHFLKHMPKEIEGFVCASDFIAHSVSRYLEENPNQFHKKLALTGYDGGTEYVGIKNMRMTVDVDTTFLGKRLASQLAYRIHNPNAPFELTYISPAIRIIQEDV